MNDFEKSLFPLPTVSQLGEMTTVEMRKRLEELEVARGLQALFSFLLGKGHSQARWVIRHEHDNRATRRRRDRYIRRIKTKLRHGGVQ